MAPRFCAAVLARRGFRVLVVGHGYLPAGYPLGDYRLPRFPHTFVGARTPIADRFFSELGLKQRFRRLATPLDPAFQLALPGHRLDVFRDDTRYQREIEREFFKVKRSVDEFHRNVVRISSEFDRVVERDLVWPPETFLERREFSRSGAQQLLDRLEKGPKLLAEFPEEHPFRLAAGLPAYFSSRIDPDQLNALGFVRLHANWHAGAVGLEKSAETLHELLGDKIAANSGAVRMEDRVDTIMENRGGVCGVRLDTTGEEIGCRHVVAGIELPSLLGAISERAKFEELFEQIGEPGLSHYRYTLNIVMLKKGLPAGMGRDVFYVRSADRPNTGENVLHVQSSSIDEKQQLLCVEALLPRREIEDEGGYLDTIRERLLDALAELVPFLEDHLLLVDSPHDGLPPRFVRAKPARLPRRYRRGPETMPAVYAYPVTSGLGLCALPVRSPIDRLLLCSSQVVPGLGKEGSLLAAWSAARIISRADRSKERMCKGLWTKVEI
jgi:hypothetical protein